MDGLRETCRSGPSVGYPLSLDIDGHRVVVVGGGAVAERKIETLLGYGPLISVVTPVATQAIARWHEEGLVVWIAREYRTGDLHDARLVFSACGVPDVDRAVCEEASEERCLVNVVDVPALCDFTVPSVLERGPLRIAVSTGGAAPAAAKSIRRELEVAYDGSWAAYLELLGHERTLIRQRIPDDAALRMRLNEEMCAAGLRERLIAGEALDAETVWQQVALPLIARQEES